MGDGDDAGRFVGEQHGAAVGGGDADGEPRHGGHDRIRTGPLVRPPRPLDRHHVGRMDLVGGEQVVRPHPERRRHARAVLRYLGGRIVGACPAVETRIDPVGHAAFAGEEGVANAGEGAQ